MRTTLTLDPDVAERLRKEAVSGHHSFKQIVNDRLRAGFGLKPTHPRKKFIVQPHASPYVPGIDRMKLNQAVDELEVEAFRDRKERSDR